MSARSARIDIKDVWVATYRQLNKALLFSRRDGPWASFEEADMPLPIVKHVAGDDMHPIFRVTVAVPLGVLPEEIGIALKLCDDALREEFPSLSFKPF